jgi:hypothetical protein
MQNLVLNARSESSGFAGKDDEFFWSIGVLEYWSASKSEGQNFKLNWFFHYSITPPLHHSRRLPEEGKEHSNPLRSLPEDRSFGPGCFTFGVVQ